MRTEDDYKNALIFGVPLPPNPTLEVPLPDNVFICMTCHDVTLEPTQICYNCNYESIKDPEEHYLD